MRCGGVSPSLVESYTTARAVINSRFSNAVDGSVPVSTSKNCVIPLALRAIAATRTATIGASIAVKCPGGGARITSSQMCEDLQAGRQMASRAAAMSAARASCQA
jgi:hypothetical protein